MRAPLRFLIIALTLACWMAPAAASVSIGLHLAMDHDHHQSEHQSELAWSGLHGHHHHDVPDRSLHDHEAQGERRARIIRRNTGSLSELPTVATVRAPNQVGWEQPGSSGTGLPGSKLNSHCCLRL